MKQTCFYFLVHFKMLFHIKLRDDMWMHRAIVKQVKLVFHDLDTSLISSRLSYLVKTIIKVANFGVVWQFEPLSFLITFLLSIEVARPLANLWSSVCGQHFCLLGRSPSAELLLDRDRRKGPWTNIPAVNYGAAAVFISLDKQVTHAWPLFDKRNKAFDRTEAAHTTTSWNTLLVAAPLRILLCPF